MLRYNIAFKCTYNNGGQGLYVGFNGTCSDEVIKMNIKNGRSWCGSKQCACRKYYENGFRGKAPIEPCYESRLFKNWEYGAGWDHSGKRGNVPRYIRKTEIGKIAIITTRFPGDNEENRRIVGLYKIGDIYLDDDTMVKADEDYTIKIPLEEAKELYFWDYYRNEKDNLCSWYQGLFRYLTDEQVAQILRDARQTIKSEKEKHLIDLMLKELLTNLKLNLESLPEPNGARPRQGTRARNIIIRRKYGLCGEGPEHKKLKDWIADNPAFLGLTGVQKIEKEQHVFPSGDLPDIVFHCKNGHYAVVEIETVDPLPGAYQALKYRTLLCAEKGLELNSAKVKTYLVAWTIPNYVKDLCNKYNINIKEKRL